jgi:VWFA-related protein
LFVVFAAAWGMSATSAAQNAPPPAAPQLPQTAPVAQTPPQQVQPTPLPPDVDANDPALPLWARNAGAVDANIPPLKTPTPSATPQPGAEPGEVTRTRRGFVLGIRVDEVTLQATVVDHDRHLVTDLVAGNFTVYEDSTPQRLTSVKYEDVPVSLGILVDNSGSMRAKRAAVTKAAINLVKASNISDEVFIVNFNDEPYLDQDFTNKIDLLREALDRVDSRGGTALYDAVIAAADHLAKGAQREKKVLLVVTDGVDNESRESLEHAIRVVQNDNGPVVYAIGILDEEGKQRQAKRALEALTTQTGGLAFFPKTLEQVDQISQEVAHDIRNQYRITYKSTNKGTSDVFHKVRVEARAEGRRGLTVRTRSGYFATGQKTEAKTPSPSK